MILMPLSNNIKVCYDQIPLCSKNVRSQQLLYDQGHIELLLLEILIGHLIAVKAAQIHSWIKHAKVTKAAIN